MSDDSSFDGSTLGENSSAAEVDDIDSSMKKVRMSTVSLVESAQAKQKRGTLKMDHRATEFRLDSIMEAPTDGKSFARASTRSTMTNGAERSQANEAADEDEGDDEAAEEEGGDTFAEIPEGRESNLRFVALH